MDDSVYIILVILACILGLFLLLRKDKSSAETPPAKPAVSGSTPAARPGTAAPKTGTGTPDVRYPKPAADPVITIFDDRAVRQVRRCPSCDGENGPYARGCVVCGRRL